ncbi:MAG: hypothetical protein JST91_00860 [Actinobacteria bacterium]|nr:hypothetical protein [Actinomycetota bacterium]
MSAQLRWDAYAEPWTHEDERARMAQRAALAAHPTSISAPAAVMTNY